MITHTPGCPEPASTSGTTPATEPQQPIPLWSAGTRDLLRLTQAGQTWRLEYAGHPLWHTTDPCDAAAVLAELRAGVAPWGMEFNTPDMPWQRVLLYGQWNGKQLCRVHVKLRLSLGWIQAGSVAPSTAQDTGTRHTGTRDTGTRDTGTRDMEPAA